MSSEANTPAKWDQTISARRGWFELNLRDLWRYRDLCYLFIKRDITTVYKQTILGPLWFIIQPLFNSLVFTIIFGNFAKIPTDGLPPFLFYLAGNTMWLYFSTCLKNTSNTFIANAGIFGKVYFPRLVAPLSGVISSLVQFLIQFTIFMAFYAYFYFSGSDLKPQIYIFFMPALILQMALMGVGFGALISSLTTRYRDLIYAMEFGVQLWMYASPVVYPLSQVPEAYRALYALNPMVSIIEVFRAAFLGPSVIQPEHILSSVVVTVVVFVAGVLAFNRVEKNFMDTV